MLDLTCDRVIPYEHPQVVLLDEFEKAHREVSNLLLQVFDEGTRLWWWRLS